MKKNMKRFMVGAAVSLLLMMGFATTALAASADDSDLAEQVTKQAQNIDVENVGAVNEENVGASIAAKQTAVGKNSIKVTWNAYSGAAGYYYAVVNTDKKVISQGIVTGTTITVSKLTQGRVYGFAVAAVDASLNRLTNIAELVCATTPANTKVRQVAYTSGGKYQLLLSYSESSVGFRIQAYNYATKKTSTKYYKTERPALSLSRKTAYKLTITPYTEINSKKYYGGKLVHYAMSPPSVKKKSHTNSSMTVQWTKMKGVNNYTIYVKKPGGGFKKTTTTTGSTYTLKNMKLNQAYYIKVIANKKAGSKNYTSPTQYYYSLRLTRY